MGVMIGMVFIYYAQYQIIRFYLPEYAILKSLGYNWWFFFFMIGQIGAANHHAGFRAVLHAFGRRGLWHHGSGPCTSACRWACARWWWRWVACVIMTVVSSLFCDPPTLEGRPHHAVRVTMSDIHNFGPPVVEAVDVHHHYGEGPQRARRACSTSTCRSAEGELVIVTRAFRFGQDVRC